MKKLFLLGVSFAAMTAAAASSASAADYPIKAGKVCDPYVNYGCLDSYLGTGFVERFINYYRLEWGHDGPPVDPKALPGRRAYWPATPQTTPPYPFTEWPYGGATSLGVSRPSAVDSPLMVALANTKVGEVMAAGNMQIYGWVNVGGNVSTNGTRPGGNFPISYTYTPNTVTLDQAVVYFERVPDTVQKDHVDWGFRLSAIYGENYRYTTSYGLMSYQLLNHNQTNGFDFPMMWGELFFPQVAEGLLVRVGRYISIPDTEAQLAPNNYMYTHSMTYTFDNYTNEGVITTTALTKNWFLTLGVSIGTEAAPWHLGQTMPNTSPNILFPSSTMPVDPGAVPSFVMGIRWQSDSGNDTVYAVMDGYNGGNWGYNNLQWTGATWYHKFNDQFHFTWEAYTLSQSRVPNLNNSFVNPGTINLNTYAQGEAVGLNTPFAAMPYNSPNAAHCGSSSAPWCTARSIATVMYWNYRYSALDNFSFRPEFYDDEEGQRTGTRTRYLNWGLGWQHWFSPQIEVRPEVNYYHSINANAFNGNFNGTAPLQATGVVTPNKNFTWIGAIDAIIHF
jgi:hypothetical protein